MKFWTYEKPHEIKQHILTQINQPDHKWINSVSCQLLNNGFPLVVIPGLVSLHPFPDFHKQEKLPSRLPVCFQIWLGTQSSIYYLGRLAYRGIILALFTSKSLLKWMKKTVSHEGKSEESDDSSCKENTVFQKLRLLTIHWQWLQLCFTGFHCPFCSYSSAFSLRNKTTFHLQSEGIRSSMCSLASRIKSFAVTSRWCSI